MDRSEGETPETEVVFDAETRFEQALQLLTRDGKIKGYIRNRRNKIYDVEGIDFMVFPRGTTLVLAAQVKAKRKRSDFQAALERHLMIHPLVEDVFGIEPRHSPQHIAFRVMKRIAKRKRALCERRCRRKGHRHS
ncbi:MAG: hypothetical protein Q8Q41_04895 [bacterium]|nr:hypothetical protein [bacterium]